MCTADLWWWVVFGCIAGSGLFGGFTRYCLDNLLADADLNANGMSTTRAMPSAPRLKHWSRLVGHLVVGLAAAFLVPLFLNSISSTLLESTTSEEHHTKLFILIGFCVAASVFAKQFIDTVSKKALRIAGEAKEESDEAKKESDEAKKESEGATKASEHAITAAGEAQAAAEDARRAARDAVDGAKDAVKLAQKVYDRTVALVRPIQAIQTGNFDEAIEHLLRVLAADRENGEGLAWLAYCYKRKDDAKSAVKTMLDAIASAEKPIFTWIYNLACYKELAGEAVEEVIKVLQQAATVANAEQKAALKNDLLTDEDFASLRERSPEFKQFIESM